MAKQSVILVAVLLGCCATVLAAVWYVDKVSADPENGTSGTSTNHAVKADGNVPPRIVVESNQIFLTTCMETVLKVSEVHDPDSSDFSFSWREHFTNPVPGIVPDDSTLDVSVIPAGSESMQEVPVFFPRPGRYEFEVQASDGIDVSNTETIVVYVPGLHGLVSFSPSDGVVRVPDAHIEAYDDQSAADVGYPLSQTPPASAAVSDSLGRYVLDCVYPASDSQASRYYLRVTRDGFETPPVIQAIVRPDPGPNDVRADLDIGRGYLDSFGGTIFNRVTGLPVAGANVVIIPGLLGLVYSDSTDQKGVFEISDVPFGSWIMQLQGPVGAPYLMPEVRDVNISPAAADWQVSLEPDAGPGSLAGTVTLAGLGTPVPYVRVSLGTGMSKITDIKGSYRFSNIPSGYYYMTLAKNGYESVREWNVWAPPGTNTIRDFQVMFADRGATVTGVVTDATTGKVLPGITVGIVNGTVFAPSDITDATGYFQLIDVPEGQQAIQAEAPLAWGYAESTTTVQIPPPASGEQAWPHLEQNIALADGTYPGVASGPPLAIAADIDPMCRTTGEAILLDASLSEDSSGLPTTNTNSHPLRFDWRESPDNPAMGLLPNRNENLEKMVVFLPAPGRYVFLVDVQDTVTLERSPRPASFTVNATGLRGNVHVSPSDGVWGLNLATVRIYGDGDYVGAVSWSPAYLDSKQTEDWPPGDFVLDAVEPDQCYWLVARREGFLQYGPVKVCVTCNSTLAPKPVNMAARSYTFDGVVTGPDPATGVVGPLEGVRVIMPPGIMAESFRTSTNRNGYFRMAEVPEGTGWPVMLMRSGFESYTFLVDISGNTRQNHQMTPLAGNEFVDVQGTVVVAFEKSGAVTWLPVAHAEVTFGFGVGKAFTDLNGHYVIRDLPPGDYYGIARKTSPTKRYISEPLADSGIIRLLPGSHNVVDFRLDLDRRDAAKAGDAASIYLDAPVYVDAPVLAGKVLDISGKPIEGAGVSVVPAEPFRLEKSMQDQSAVYTSFTGSFTLVGVPEGIQTVEVQLPDGTTFRQTVMVGDNTEVVLYGDMRAADSLLVTPGTDFASFGPVGGPFSPAFVNYTLHNSSAAALTYAVLRRDDWIGFRIAPTQAIQRSLSGTLSGGGDVAVGVYIDQGAAGGLSIGEHVNVVLFYDITAGLSEDRNVVLTAYTPAHAEFSADVTSGIGTLTANFTDESTGDYAKAKWDFGDGTSVVETIPPTKTVSHAFEKAGTFTVTLTLSGKGASTPVLLRKTGYITVYAASAAAFSGAPTAGPAPLTVSFTDQSTGDYDSAVWGFGDNTGTVQSDPKATVPHTYDNLGQYDVTLSVNGSGGPSSRTLDKYITVYAKIYADFAAAPITGIAGTEVSFTNLSVGGYTALEWDFGDGSLKSAETDPKHIYKKKGVFTVSLTASRGGDSDTTTVPNLITITAPVPAFSATTSTTVIAPKDVCFKNESQGYYESLRWNFGDGTIVTQAKSDPDPCHTYQRKGIYDVTLTMVGPAGAPDESLKKAQLVTVYQATHASFIPDRVSGGTPLTVNFTSNSTGDYSSGEWDFGDGSPKQPVSATISHVFTEAGMYNTCLSLSGDGGSDQYCQEIAVYAAAHAAFSADKTSGVAPFTVTFKNESTGDYDTAAWDFGDGTAPETAAPGAGIAHEYTTEGKFTVALTLSGKGAPTPVSLRKTDYITAYRAAGAAFKADKTSGIADLVVKFTDQSTGDYDTVTWDFGDGSASQVAAPKAEISHTYKAKGAFSVKITLTGNGAPTPVSLTKPDFITVFTRAQAAFSGDKRKGVVPFEVQFKNESTGDYSTQTWDFGDGSVVRLNRGAPDPTHTYATKGVYTVSLTLEGDGGTNKLTQPQYISAYAPVEANLSATPAEGPFPLGVTFTDGSTGDYDKAKWDFGDDTSVVETIPPIKTVSHTFEKAGTFTVTLTILDKDGVEHTKTALIKAYTPVSAEFSATPTQGVYPLNVTFTDLSTGEYDTATWNFGDGSNPVVKKPPVKSISHTYTKRGNFTVSLRITGKGGTDEEVKTELVTVANTVTAAFTSDVRSGVAPLTVKFTNTSTGDYGRSSWDFDCDSNQDSAATSPSFTYRDPGIYNVCLTVSGPGGTSAVAKEQYIKVYAPSVADFSATPTSGLTPLAVQFTNLSTGDCDKFSWDFDSDGNPDSALRDPVYTYTQSGIYTVTLTASGFGGTSKKIRSQLISAYLLVLSVNPTAVQLGSWIGSGYPISVTNAGNGPLKWKASVLTGGDWLSVSPTAEFTGDGELLLSYAENFMSGSRTATISVEAADAQNSPVTVTVTQQGKGISPTPQLSVTPTQVSIDSTNGTVRVYVENSGGGTLEWTAYMREGSAWAGVTSGGSGTNDGTVELAYTKNTVNVPRTAVLRVRGVTPDVGFLDVLITQASAPVKPHLTVSPGNQTVESESTGTSFDVFNPNGGTMYWAAEVTSGNDWLTITVGSQGTSDGTIVTACAANPSTSPRTGSIRVTSSNADGGPIDVTVTQNGKTGGCYGSPIDAASGVGFSGDAFLMMLAAGALLVTGARASRRFVQR